MQQGEKLFYMTSRAGNEHTEEKKKEKEMHQTMEDSFFAFNIDDFQGLKTSNYLVSPHLLSCGQDDLVI